MNEVIDLLKNHMSIREYKDNPIRRDIVNNIIQCAQMASTSSHFQSYTIIEVLDKEKREVLFEVSGGQNGY